MTKSGLDDVIATETRLSDVDGEAGRLIIVGLALEELAGRAGYEETASLLLRGLFNEPVNAHSMREQVGQARVEVFARMSRLDADLAFMPPVDAMRALIALLPDQGDLRCALTLMAAPAVFLPALLRMQKGLALIAPDERLSQSADILRMLTGAMPDESQVAALDAYLVTICDHGLNASTFAARVVASTQAGLTSAVVAAISALKGPLHGGAPGPVLDMLDSIEKPELARSWLSAALDRGDRLMGFGHRIYRVRDPRADALKAALGPLVASGRVNKERIALAESVERAALAILRERKPNRSLDVNVEFYTAVLLESLGFPRDAFTGVFAIGRTVGWIAHAREQAIDGRLIRPKSAYVGEMPAAA
ncbi:citrate synthase/methylcitrate synthase [Oryzifoliimicrobium ureilyticus]|uniref:citrate synthase/methylcitrate synthase n=1 Tax=Oryzifoliimicrobium ureilyticus TaxID=3113724 RepID=UPI0030766AEE